MQNRIKQVRKDKGITQLELAEKLGITRAGVSQIERSDNVRIDTLTKVASALDCKVADLLPLDDFGQYFRETMQQIDDDYLSKLNEIAVKLNHQGRKVLIEMAIHMSHDKDYTTPDYEEQMRAWGFSDYLDRINK